MIGEAASKNGGGAGPEIVFNNEGPYNGGILMLHLNIYAS